MNKTTILKIVSTAGTVLGAVAGIAAYNNLIPASLLPYAVAVGSVSVSLHKVVDTIGDLLDDGQANGSFKS